jgi:hypothetical protein
MKVSFRKNRTKTQTTHVVYIVYFNIVFPFLKDISAFLGDFSRNFPYLLLHDFRLFGILRLCGFACADVEYVNCGQFARNTAENEDARGKCRADLPKKGTENNPHGIMTMKFPENSKIFENPPPQAILWFVQQYDRRRSRHNDNIKEQRRET